MYGIRPGHGDSAQRSLSQQQNRAITYCELVHVKAGYVGIIVVAKLVVEGGGTLSPINPKLAQLKGSALPPVVS